VTHGCVNRPQQHDRPEQHDRPDNIRHLQDVIERTRIL
jgi:hypothetical protein